MIKKSSVILLYIFVFGMILLRNVDAYGNGDKKPVEKSDSAPKIVIEEKRVRFLDGEGRTSKEIKLREEKIVEVDRKIDGIIFTEKIERSFYRSAHKPEKAKYIVIAESYSDHYLPKNDEEKHELENNPEWTNEPFDEGGKIYSYDETGKLNWEYALPRLRVVMDTYTSDDGEIIAFITTCGLTCDNGEIGRDTLEHALYVFDKSGNKLLTYPEYNSNIRIRHAQMTPNGRYFALWGCDISRYVPRAYPDLSEITIVIDTNNKKTWVIDGAYNSIITDSGHARLRNVETDEIMEVDLKQHLGE